MPYTVKRKKDIGKAISELHTGNTYKKTKAKHGKSAANRQAVAIAYSMLREHRRKHKAYRP